MKTLPEIFEPAERYSLPNPPHGVKVKAQIMQRVKGASGHLAGHGEVSQIGPGKVAAGIAAARRIGGSIVFRKLRVLDVYGALASEELTVPGVSRRHDAVEHVDAPGDRFDQVDRRPDTH